MRVFQKTCRLFALACVGFALFACGDSSSSSKSDDLEDELPGKDIDADNKVSDATYYRDRIYNSSTGSYLNTIQFGMYIWLEDNSTESTSYTSSSTCYDNEPDNCYAYGRLYSPGASRCPSGFTVPTKDDWSRTMSYLKKHSEIDSIFGFSLGGYCREGMNGVACSEKDNAGYYMVNDSAVAIVKGRSVSFRASSEEEFYQVRCVKYTYIVPEVEDLPDCDTTNQYSLKPYYVMNKKSNFRCIGTRWVDDFSDNCSHVDDGTSAVYNDSMYICKSDRWQLADITDSRDACDSKNDESTYLFNGILYFCENERWRQLNSIEKKLGVCKTSLHGTNDSLVNGEDFDYELLGVYYTSYLYYTCDSAGWRKSSVSDLAGECDKSSLYEEYMFNGVNYVCRSKGWDTFTDLEEEIGVCSPKRLGVIDTFAIYGYHYVCDTTGWRFAEKHDYLGDCTPTNDGAVRDYGKTKYVCRDTVWKELYGLEASLGTCTSKNKGAIDTTNTGYVCYCDTSGWRYATPEDFVGECTSSKKYEVVDLVSYRYYCYNNEWQIATDVDELLGICWDKNVGTVDSTRRNRSYYYCDSTGWRSINKADVVLGVCVKARYGETQMFGDSLYKCVAGLWEKQSESDFLGACSKYSNWGETKTYLGKEYACKYSGWTEMNEFDRKNGICSGNNLGKVIKVGSTYYRCSKKDWVVENEETALLGDCDDDTDPIYATGSDGTSYLCSDYNWTEATSIESVYGQCKLHSEPRTVVYNGQEYICDTEAYANNWYPMLPVDSVKGYCSNAMGGDTLIFKGEPYKCIVYSSKHNKWERVSYREYMGTCTTTNEGLKMFNGLGYSVCTMGEWIGSITETMTDSRDNQKYRILKINGVTWMVDNLNYASDSSKCVNGKTVCDVSGRYYSLTSAKKACPAGWSLPDSAAWVSMRTYVESLDSSMKNIFWNADVDFYGLEMPATGGEITYLLNGQDKQTKIANTEYGAYYWNSEGSYTSFATYRMFDSGLLGAEDIRPISLAVRCVKE